MTAPKDPSSPLTKPVVHLGSIVRDLRQAAGISRKSFSEQLGGIISECDIRRFEFNRTVLTRPQLARLYQHAAMEMLPELAAEAGIDLPANDLPLARAGKDRGVEES